MQIILRRNSVKQTLVLLETAILLTTIIWITRAFLADIFAKRPTKRDLQLAVKLDPGNSDYQLLLGRLYEYNPADADAALAVNHFRRALELNPLDPQPWLEMAAALEFQGEINGAEACLHRADSLAPQIPTIQWTIGNLFLLHGKVDEAFRHFKIVLAGSSRYNQILFDLAWKASGDANSILGQLIPNNTRTEFSYLDYLLSRRRYLEAQIVWKRIVNSPEIFLPAQAASYIDALISADRPEEAYQVWSDLGKKGQIRAPSPQKTENLLTNANFEGDLLNFGFDWRIWPLEGVYTRLDQTTFRSPGHALLIQFSGKQNFAYQHFFQYVIVQPGQSYRLQGFMKTEGITTDSGPRLEARNPYDTNSLDKYSEDVRGSTGGWIPISLEFKAGPKTKLVRVGIARLPSRKLDNLIQGKVWVDDLTLTSVPQEEERARK